MPSPVMTARETKTRHRQKEAHSPDSSQEQADIEILTVSGHNALIRENYAEALDCFSKAFKASLVLKETRVQQVCAFNLGAAYVESGKPQKGVEFLRQAQPGERGDRIADLQFNLGAAYEGLKNPDRAAKHYLQAAQLYRSQGEGSSEGDACMKLALCYLCLQDWTQAAQSYQRAGESYRAAGRFDASAVALKEAAEIMLQSDGFTKDDITNVLSECLKLSASIKNTETLGELYNDIGMSFSQLKMFQEAAECFKQAFPLAQCRPRRLAVVLQNMGAVHNTLGQHQEALNYHLQAVTLHGTLGSRGAQGQCFSNLAFALSQLGDHEQAEENYLHALQAFKDAGDPQGQWQACEELGTTWICLGNPKRAMLYYKQALGLLSKCKDFPEGAQERLVDKLASAVQDGLSLQNLLSHERSQTAVLPQTGHFEGTPTPQRNTHNRIHYKQAPLRFAGCTVAKPSDPLCPGPHPLDFSHQSRKGSMHRHKMENTSQGSTAEAPISEQVQGQRIPGASREEWDNNRLSPKTESDSQLKGPQSALASSHIVMDEANRNLNNTCLQPVLHCQKPAVSNVSGAAQYSNYEKMAENSNPSLAKSSVSSVAEEEAIPLHRKLKSRVCTIM